MKKIENVAAGASIQFECISLHQSCINLHLTIGILHYPLFVSKNIWKFNEFCQTRPQSSTNEFKLNGIIQEFLHSMCSIVDVMIANCELQFDWRQRITERERERKMHKFITQDSYELVTIIVYDSVDPLLYYVFVFVRKNVKIK